MSERKIPITQEGLGISGVTYDTSGFDGTEIDSLQNITESLKTMLKKQINAQRKIENSVGIDRLQEIFNASSFGNQAFFAGNFYQQLDNLLGKQRNKKMPSSDEINKMKEQAKEIGKQQQEIYKDIEKIMTKWSKSIQGIDFTKIKDPRHFLMEKLDEALKQTKTTSVNLEKTLIRLKNSLKTSNIENYITNLKNVSRNENGKISDVEIRRHGNGFKISYLDGEQKENDSKEIAKLLSNFLNSITSSVENGELTLKQIQESHNRASIKSGSALAVIQKRYLDLIEKLTPLLADGAEEEQKEKILKKFEKAIFSHFKINKDGKISFSKFNLREEIKIATEGLSHSAIGNIIELSFSDHNNIELANLFTNEEIAASIFTGKDVIKRAQLRTKYDFKSTITGMEKIGMGDDINLYTSNVAPKIDNIEIPLIERDGKKQRELIIAFSDKFVENLNSISIVGNTTLLNSADLLSRSDDPALQHILYLAQLNSTASVLGSEQKRNTLKQISEKVLTAHFMDIAFDINSVETQIAEVAPSSISSNILYVVRATNGYYPASHILSLIYESLGRNRLETLGSVVNATIKYDTSRGGIEGSLYKQAVKNAPNKGNEEARWNYVSAAIAANTDISATLNLKVLNAFMNFSGI